MINRGQPLEGRLILKQLDTYNPVCRLLFFPHNISGGATDGPEFSNIQILFQKISSHPFNLSLHDPIPFKTITGMAGTFCKGKQQDTVEVDLTTPAPERIILLTAEFLPHFNN